MKKLVRCGVRFVFFLGIIGKVQAQETQLISFALEDQFAIEYSANSWADSLIVMLGSDKDGAVYNEAWAKALYTTLQKEAPHLPIKYIGLADLSAVPFFLKGAVKQFFRKEQPVGVLMDWEGIFPDAYQFRENHCNILVFNYQRELIFQKAVTTLEQEVVQRVVTVLKAY